MSTQGVEGSATAVDASVWTGVLNAISTYAHALDGGRPADLAATFAPYGVSEIVGVGTFEGRQAIAEGYAGFSPTRPQLHLVANTIVTQEDADTARATSSLAFLASGEAGWSVLMTGRYDDTLTLSAGVWLFSRRITTLAP